MEGKINIDIDGLDLMLLLFAFGGFWKDFWLPFILLLTLVIFGLGRSEDN